MNTFGNLSISRFRPSLTVVISIVPFAKPRGL